jgi:hypothetical protein
LSAMDTCQLLLLDVCCRAAGQQQMAATIEEHWLPAAVGPGPEEPMAGSAGTAPPPGAAGGVS